MKLTHRFTTFILGVLLTFGMAVPSLAQSSAPANNAGVPKFTAPKGGIHYQPDSDSPVPAMSVKPRGGSFGGGGGGRSFGGGGGGRSFGGGSSTGSFGGGSRTFGGSSSSPRTSSQSGTSSFNRSGAMGSSGPTRSTSVSGPRGTSSFYYGGHTYYGYGYGGYSYGWMHPVWYMYTPFYPTFYYNQPYMDSMGYYHAGGFSFIHALGGLCCCPLIFIGIIWMLSKSFGGGKRIKYTSSN